jgi:hypothetical protein
MITTAHKLRITLALLKRDARVMLYTFFDNILDSCFLVGFIYLIYGHLLPAMGGSRTLINPTFIGLLVLILINIGYDRALHVSLDFDLSCFITYQQTLPLTLPWILARYVGAYMLDLFVSSVPVVIIGKIVFGPLLHFDMTNPGLVVLMYSVGILFLSLWFLTLVVVQTFTQFRENTWPCFLLPLTLLGCLYFPWKLVYYASPLLGKALLLIPTTLFAEGLRSVTMVGDYIAVWWCLGGLLCYSIILFLLLRKFIIRRLDLV